MKNVKLRLDYFLSLGLKLAEDDTYEFKNIVHVIADDSNALFMSQPDFENKYRLIRSFAPRENTGAQPCGDDVPVCIKFEGSTNTHSAIIPTGVRWPIELQDSDIGTWKPCIESLIKMQIEHDRKLALTAECEKMTEAALKQGDKQRIEFMSNHTGQLEIHAVTYQFETDKEICCIAEDGLILLVDKEEFVAWHDAVDEMKVAKEKQIKFIYDVSVSAGYRVNKRYIRFIQDNNMLAEITLLLKN